MNRFTISEATAPEARAAVFRFRYQVYVQEMRRREPKADHRTRTLSDELDDTARIIAVTDTRSGRVVGTVRHNLLRDGSVGLYERLYRLDTLSVDERNASSITTRFMIAADQRGGRLAMALLLDSYQLATRCGITQDWMDCNPHLVQFFTRMGYRDLGQVLHPSYGQVHLMRLHMCDRSHLTAVRSPFLATVPEAVTSD